MGFRFAASLAGRYPNSTPTPLETTSATATAVQEIPSGTIPSVNRGPTRRVKRSHYAHHGSSKTDKECFQ